MAKEPKTRNRYSPDSDKPYKLSRSGIESFLECPRCFYLDKRLGVSRPAGFPFNLNSAVDALLKKEFDSYRERGRPHPLMKKYDIDAIPFAHAELEDWRENFKGIRFHHKKTNFLITGAVDDLWVNPKGELIVVDYKSTAKNDDITSLDEDWHGGYKRQMEVYQWLLRQIGFKVAKTAYWVYANGDKSAPSFDATLKFRMTVISYKGDDSWVEETIRKAKKCLDAAAVPQSAEDCEYCDYVRLSQTF